MFNTAALMISASLPGWALAVIIVLAVLFAAAAAGIAFLLLFKPKAGGKAVEKVKEADGQESKSEEEPQINAEEDGGKE